MERNVTSFHFIYMEMECVMFIIIFSDIHACKYIELCLVGNGDEDKKGEEWWATMAKEITCSKPT